MFIKLKLWIIWSCSNVALKLCTLVNAVTLSKTYIERVQTTWKPMNIYYYLWQHHLLLLPLFIFLMAMESTSRHSVICLQHL